MDSITIIIVGMCGVFLGTALGMYVAALFAARRIARCSADSWRNAERFYRTAYTLTPKD